jgi:hypothetical protein
VGVRQQRKFTFLGFDFYWRTEHREQDGKEADRQEKSSRVGQDDG